MRVHLVSAATIVMCMSIAGIASSAPDWVKSLEKLPVPSYDEGVQAVVLVDELKLMVKENGAVELNQRYAVKVLRREGASAARRLVYYDSSNKLVETQAWHIRPDGRIIKLGRNEIMEESITEDLYSDTRAKVLRFSDVGAGSIVAFEWEKRVQPVVNQDFHYFQTEYPVLISKYQITLPPGSKIEWQMMNYTAIPPQILNHTYSWELRNLPAVTQEPYLPDSAGLMPCLGVSYMGPGDNSISSLSNWKEVSIWASKVMAGRTGKIDLIAAKTRELIAGLSTDDQKARAIIHWVQSHVRYISFQLGKKGGYQPNLASVVLKKGYGDCKDKCNLAQEMLKAAGINSWIFLVYSGDPTRIKPEFPSPFQFNHTIIAYPSTENTPATIVYPQLGKLILFDPTDKFTTIGEIPYYLQGGYGLLVHPDGGFLIKLPADDEEANKALRTMEAGMGLNGDIRASVTETYIGQLALSVWQHDWNMPAASSIKQIETRLKNNVPGALMFRPMINRDAGGSGPLIAEYQFTAPSFGNNSGNLLLLRPLILWDHEFPVFIKRERNGPVYLKLKYVSQDAATFNLPDGFEVDELPSQKSLNTSFGSFTLAYRLERNHLTVSRRVSIKKEMIPASDYNEVKRFFDEIFSASQTPVILIKKKIPR